MNTPPPTQRFALIGHGRIGSEVVRAWQEGQLPGWELVGVLVRDLPERAPPWLTNDRDHLLAGAPAVVVEAAGPAALAAHAVATLAVADVWTVSAAALADAALVQRIEAAARTGGHRLRVLPGAMAGLDGVATLATDSGVVLDLEVELLPGDAPAADLFEGNVREAPRRFPLSVNVAAAAALAGPGLDTTRIRVRHPGPVPRNRLALRADSRFGTVRAEVWPRVQAGAHPVAAHIIAALQRHIAPIWVG